MIKRYWLPALIVFCALSVGLLYVSPQLLIKNAVQESGQTFVLSQFNNLDDGGDSYLQFAREVYDGHFPPSDLYFEKKLPNIYPPIPPLLLSLFIAIAGGDISSGYLTGLFVFPAILFLLLFWLGWIIFDRNKIWSLFLALCGILTPMALHASRAFFSPELFSNIVLKNFYPGIQTLLPLIFWSRIDYPLLTNLVYLSAIAAVLIFWLRPTRKNALIAGAISGLLFYTYFHLWSYWVTIGGLLFLAAIFLLRADKERLKNFWWLAGTVLVFGAPYLLNQIKLNALPGYPDYIGRLGLSLGHNLTLSAWPHYLVYALLAFLVYRVFWKKFETKSYALFYWSVLAAAFIVWNVQLVIGFVPHPDHWPRAIDPIIFLMVFHLIYWWVNNLGQRYSINKKIVPATLILLSVLLVTKKVVNALSFIKPPERVVANHTMPADWLSAWRWLDQNTGEAKVLTDSYTTSSYLMAFSSARPYLAQGGLAPLTNFEIEERFLTANKLLGVPEKVLEGRLRGEGPKCDFECDRNYSQSNLSDARLHIYQLFYQHRPGDLRNQIPEEKIGELLERFRKIKPDWRAVEADYVYHGPLERQFSPIDPADNGGLELAYQNSAVAIYRIKK